MKKRTEIQQDLKRGFGSAPTGIKIWAKRLAVGLLVYLAVWFACAFVGGMVVGLGGILPTLAALVVLVFLIRAACCILSALLSFFVFCLLLILFFVIL